MLSGTRKNARLSLSFVKTIQKRLEQVNILKSFSDSNIGTIDFYKPREYKFHSLNVLSNKALRLQHLVVLTAFSNMIYFLSLLLSDTGLIVSLPKIAKKTYD